MVIYACNHRRGEDKDQIYIIRYFYLQSPIRQHQVGFVGLGLSRTSLNHCLLR
jgi:hypothetical protein